MASFIYNKCKTKMLKGDLDFDEVGADIRVALAMTNTTCDTEDDTEFMDGFTTEDWMDGANYVRKALAQSVVENLPSNLAYFDAVDITWTALGAGLRQVAGMVIFRHVTTDVDSIPIAWIDTGGFPFSANGGDVTVTWNAAGVISLS